jgi:hypothetical protein
MLRTLPLVVALLAAASASAQDDEDEIYEPDRPAQLPQGMGDTRPGGFNLGLGLSLGAPSGVVGKYHVSPGAGVQFGIGGAGHGFLSLHLDYVFSVAEIATGVEGWLYAYGGAGVGLGLFGNYNPVFGRPYFVNAFFAAADVHLTGGLAWNFRQAPVDVFVELSPGVLVIPGIGFGWHGMIGFRYYFA